jgi:hypothetical protein
VLLAYCEPMTRSVAMVTTPPLWLKTPLPA